MFGLTTKVRWEIPAAFSATLVYLICGSFLGWSAPTIPRLLNGNTTFPFTPDDSSWVVSLLSVGMVLMPVPAGYALDAVGPKLLLIGAGGPLLLSWVILALANSAHIVMVARVVGSLGMAVTFTVGPVYLGEIATPSIRGAVGTLFQVMMNLGTLFEYCVGPYVSFHNLALISAIFPIIFLLTFPWMPESPYYLIIKKRRNDAETAISRLRGTTDPEKIKAEVDLIQKTVDADLSKKASYKELFLSPGNRRALLIVVTLMLLQHCSGIIVILAYGTQIFTNSGSTIDADLSVIILGVVMLVISIVSSMLVDKAGRKPLLRISFVGTAISLIALGTYFFLKTNTTVDVSEVNWLPIAVIIIFLVTYSLGLGPLPWAIVGEVFATNVKSIAVAVVSMSSAICSFTITKLFQVVSDNLGAHVAFWFFAACCIVGVFIEVLFLPETKGKSFLEIQEYFHTNEKNKEQELKNVATRM